MGSSRGGDGRRQGRDAFQQHRYLALSFPLEFGLRRLCRCLRLWFAPFSLCLSHAVLLSSALPLHFVPFSTPTLHSVALHSHCYTLRLCSPPLSSLRLCSLRLCSLPHCSIPLFSLPLCSFLLLPLFPLSLLFCLLRSLTRCRLCLCVPLLLQFVEVCPVLVGDECAEHGHQARVLRLRHQEVAHALVEGVLGDLPLLALRQRRLELAVVLLHQHLLRSLEEEASALGVGGRGLGRLLSSGALLLRVLDLRLRRRRGRGGGGGEHARRLELGEAPARRHARAPPARRRR
mmetsp:Transcript_11818/g.47696  ORF Transcript_11818/g.47696 Transcript_11818/m.47696 type:complete len:289 (-) Transcript_11818:32-898(-)